MLHPAVLDGTGQRDFPAADPDFDVAGVDVRVMGQPFAQVLVDPGVGTGVVPRAHSAVAPASILAAGLPATELRIGRTDEARLVVVTGVAVLVRVTIAGA